MKVRYTRVLTALLCVLLALPSVLPAFAASYPYDTTSGQSVKLRRYANTTSVVLATINEGDTVSILGKSGSFYKVEYNGKTGYAMSKYIDGAGETAAGTTEKLTAVTKYPYDTVTTARVNLRKSDDASASVILVVPSGAAVTVKSVTATGFAKVQYNKKTGYVKTDYLVLANIPTPTPIPSPTVNPNAIKYSPLKFGDSGSGVRALQEALAELKFYTSKVDSKYGNGTKAAVTAFEKQNGLKQDGAADQELQYLLYEGRPKNAKGTKVRVKTVPPVTGITIKSGSTGEQVEKLQKRLTQLGYYAGEVNGTCDKATVAAIKAFQKKMGISADGTATYDVLTILYGSAAVSSADTVTPTPTPALSAPSGTVQSGSRGTDAKVVQQRLSQLGYYTGKVDGNFGSGSVSALKKFQQTNGIAQTGIADSTTNQVLFSASAVAKNGLNAAASATATPAPSTSTTLDVANTATIKAGARGSAVLALQNRLTELGYYVSRRDGVYLADDIAAVRAFQKANGLSSDGMAGQQTLTVMFGTSAVRGTLDTSSTAGTTTTLRYGDTGADVTTLQNRLIELKYMTGTADGSFGTATRTALSAFQKANGLSADGVAGTKTLTTLYASSAKANSVSTSTTLKLGAINETVKELQSRLITLGYLTGSADGNFGVKTQLALIAFQQANGLTADGVAGSKTIAKINSTNAVSATGTTSSTTSSAAPTLTSVPSAASVRYANWYTEVKARCKLYPNATLYDFTTGISWQVNMFSLGAHADAEPLTAEDTAKMFKAFGGKETWTPKAVWVVFSDGRVYLGSTHDVAHTPYHIKTNNFNGHLCIHFPRTEDQVAAIGPYATSHQKAIDLAWTATLARIGK